MITVERISPVTLLFYLIGYIVLHYGIFKAKEQSTEESHIKFFTHMSKYFHFYYIIVLVLFVLR